MYEKWHTTDHNVPSLNNSLSYWRFCISSLSFLPLDYFLTTLLSQPILHYSCLWLFFIPIPLLAIKSYILRWGDKCNLLCPLLQGTLAAWPWKWSRYEASKPHELLPHRWSSYPTRLASSILPCVRCWISEPMTYFFLTLWHDSESWPPLTGFCIHSQWTQHTR